MLVLSRRENEKITFPDLGIAVEILRLASNQVRVGVEAPQDVHILRGELTVPEELKNKAAESHQERHEIRNRLNTANLALHLIKKQMDAGLQQEAEETLKRTLEDFSELNSLIASRSKPSFTPVDSERPKRRALVVEDNAQERELLAGYLRLFGYEVDVAQDGVEAIEFLEEHSSPDLVLLDMQMPRMSGPETLSAIRCNVAHKDLKIYAVSGSDRNSLKINWNNRGVDGWFSKPLKPDAFIHELNQELEKPTKCSIAG